MEGVLCRPVTRFYSGNDSFGMAKSISIYSNQDHCQYYHNNYRWRSLNPWGIRCSVATEKDDRKNKKMKKKQKEVMKLLKGLSGDVAMPYGGLPSLEVSYNQEWKDASEALLSQLKKLKSEQKEAKKKMEEGKKMKKEKAKMKGADCNSTSSSSSESSESECERKVLDISRLKHETNTLPPSSVTLNEEENIRISEKDSNNILLSLLEKENEAAKEKKGIEVCMGGKCKRSGAGALLKKFQKVAGADVDVVGCKCMGKCRDGPNVRLVSPPPIDGLPQDNELLQHNHRQVAVTAATATDPRSVMTRTTAPRPSYPLCIGVGLDDVSLIVSKFVGDHAEGVV